MMVEDVRNVVDVTATWLFIGFDYFPIDFIDVASHYVARTHGWVEIIANLEHFDFSFGCW